MDSNQTRLQLLLGRDDWSRCTALDGTPVLPATGDISSLFSWDSTRLELTLAPRLNVFQSSLGNRVPTMDQRRGAAADRFGNIYWISNSQTEILVRSSGTFANDHFWSSSDELPLHCARALGFVACPPVSPPAPLAFSGLTVTEEHYLVVGTVQPAGLMIFDLFRGGPPRRLLWPTAVPFAPFEMAAAVGGGFWIFDRDNARLWPLDRTFAVIRDNQGEVELSSHSGNVFGPLDFGPHPPRRPQTFPTGISLDSASPLQQIDAVAMTVLPDNSVLLLENPPAADFSVIHRVRNGAELGRPVSLDCLRDLLEPEDQDGFQLLGFDFVFIANEQTPGGTRENTLYVVGQNGDQAWGFTVDYSSDQLSLTPLQEYYPMRLFGGSGAIAGATQVFYNSQFTWVPLVMQRRPRYVEEAVLLTFTMDGKQPNCVWDRLMLDAGIPGETQVQIYSRAGNDPRLLKSQSWMQEPALYMRGDGTELPWTQNAPWDATWELLFQSAVGQYLQLQLVLSGNRQLTPRLRALRAYYPRFSYLEHYLPAVYREDEQSASFLERLLCNFEGFYTSIEDRLASVQALFDPASVPSESLDWLAKWFGIALDPSWSDDKRRLFISNAATFFEARGTVPGLMMALRLTLEDCADQSIFTDPISQSGARLVESYQKRWLPPGLRQKPATGLTIQSPVQTTIWTPNLGPDELNQRYAAAIGSPGASYPIYLSPGDPLYKRWNAFSSANIGLVPAQPESPSLWGTFLQGRYRTANDLNSAYGTTYSDLGQVPFPDQLPRRPQPLWDWYQVQGILMIEASSHQFTIFLPMNAADAQNVMAQQAKVELVRRVINLEKPAHTSYDIKFFWAFFRLGDARLGQDSVLDTGSRAPQLMSPAQIGDTYLGSTYLSRQPQPRPFLKQGSSNPC
jgi:phage tail-like protein